MSTGTSATASTSATATASTYRAGLANRLLIYFVTLGGGAVGWLVLDPIVSEFLARTTDRCQVSACTTGAGWVDTAWQWAPLWILILAGFFQLVGGAIIEARRTP